MNSPAASSSTTTAAVPKRIGFLGPRGTFTEQALRSQADLVDAELIPHPSMSDVLLAVDDGELDAGFVAIENALEGTVNVTVDTLAFDVDLLIQREVVIPVEMCLLGHPGAIYSELRQIISFGHASAQCRLWIRSNAPQAEIVTARSTAEAAEMVAASANQTVAAIANSLAGTLYSLDVLASDIADHPENSTRFVVVQPGTIPAPTGHDKTSLLVYQRADRPGSLLSILQEFAARSINLTLLESRPTKTALGNYCFLLDLEGHVLDPIVADCLRALKATQGGVKFLGSYPAARSGANQHRAEMSAEFRGAEMWLDELRSRVVPND